MGIQYMQNVTPSGL